MLKQKTILLITATVFIGSGCSSDTPVYVVPASIPVAFENDASAAIEFEDDIGDKVFFDFNNSVLNDKAKDQLRKQIKWLSDHPKVVVVIEGHCDERGGDEYNLKLGYKRAKAIEIFLLEHGISSKRIDVVSYGKRKPDALEHNEKAWARNRRGVTSVTIRAAQI